MVAATDYADMTHMSRVGTDYADMTHTSRVGTDYADVTHTSRVGTDYADMTHMSRVGTDYADVTHTSRVGTGRPPYVKPAPAAYSCARSASVVNESAKNSSAGRPHCAAYSLRAASTITGAPQA